MPCRFAAVPDAPTANATTVSAREDKASNFVLTGSDPDGDSLTVVRLSDPSHGHISGTPPKLSYMPTANCHGSDALAFLVIDPSGRESGSATVSITVQSVNDAPSVGPQTVTMASADGSVSIKLIGSDPEGEVLTWVRDSEPEHGSLSGTARHRVDTPVSGFVGDDIFLYHVLDTALASSATAAVTLRVTSSNRAPTVASVTILPSQPTKALTPRAIVGDVVDPDGDGVTLTYAWYKSFDGASFSLLPTATHADLASALYQKLNWLKVWVTPTDSLGAVGATVTSAAVKIQNARPSAPMLASLSAPEPGWEGHDSVEDVWPREGQDDVLCSLSGVSNDPDGDPVQYQFKWYACA